MGSHPVDEDLSAIRSFRQGPHAAHQRTLQMTAEDPAYKYKLICRIDDDIILEPDYLEKLYAVFLEDEGAEVAAVSGVLLDPKRSEGEQMAPPGFEGDVNYAGLIEPNVPWPYICKYPEGTRLRPAEHLYSSFMYRVEVATSIGGYYQEFSQIGHREESDFSYSSTWPGSSSSSTRRRWGGTSRPRPEGSGTRPSTTRGGRRPRTTPCTRRGSRGGGSG